MNRNRKSADILRGYFRPLKVAKDAVRDHMKEESERPMSDRSIGDIFKLYFSPVTVAVRAVLDDIKNNT